MSAARDQHPEPVPTCQLGAQLPGTSVPLPAPRLTARISLSSSLPEHE